MNVLVISLLLVNVSNLWVLFVFRLIGFLYNMCFFVLMVWIVSGI